MFSGIGGFELGIARAKKNSQCVGYSEIDKYAIKIYEKHFKHKGYGDCTEIAPGAIPDIDLLCGGFPCQPFSSAGKQQGFLDSRGQLFIQIARILEIRRPAYCLLENVRGLLYHDGGRTFRAIITTLSNVGYDVEWQVLDSQNFGVPQQRRRVFIIGHLRDKPTPAIFPIFPDDRRNDKTNGQPQASSLCLTNNGGYRGDPTAATYIANTITTTQYGSTKTQRRRHENAIAYENECRMLTPTECERLQGFPDGWTAGVSDRQRYKTLGNAVTVNVIEAIIKKLID